MNIILVSIPISIVLAGLAIAAFIWAINSGQYDDLDSPAYNLLMDDDETPSDSKERRS